MANNRRRRRILAARTVVVVCIATALWGCSSEDPIKIGFVAGTSGHVADLGISGRDAAELAVDQCNQAGGIAGRQVQLVIRDDQQQPETARSALQELIDEDVAAIIGPMTSDMGVVMAPIAETAQMLLISPTVTTENLSGRDDHFFRVSSTTRAYATRSANYQIKSGAMHSVAAAYDLRNRSFSLSWLKHFTQAFSAGGGTIKASVGFDATAGKTFLGIAHELMADEPDGIVIIANSMDSALLCQQIRKIDARIPITLADWGATERLLELGGQAVEGVTVVQTFDRDSSAPRYQAFRKAYMERYQREPGFPGVYTYDAVQVLLTALRAQKKGQTLKETILSLRRFEGLQSEFSFDDFGDVSRPHASISVVRNRQFVILE